MQSQNVAAFIFGIPQWTRPTPEMQARLDATVITGRKSGLAVRPDCSEDSGLSYCGRPRNPKPRRRANLSMYDAQNTWAGQR